MSSTPWGNETERAEWYKNEYHRTLEKLEHYESLKEQGRLIELPEGFNLQRLLQPLIDKYCPDLVGLHDKEDCRGIGCKECWEEALKGSE